MMPFQGKGSVMFVWLRKATAGIQTIAALSIALSCKDMVQQKTDLRVKERESASSEDSTPQEIEGEWSRGKVAEVAESSNGDLSTTISGNNDAAVLMPLGDGAYLVFPKGSCADNCKITLGKIATTSAPKLSLSDKELPNSRGWILQELTGNPRFSLVWPDESPNFVATLRSAPKDGGDGTEWTVTRVKRQSPAESASGLNLDGPGGFCPGGCFVGSPPPSYGAPLPGTTYIVGYAPVGQGGPNNCLVTCTFSWDNLCKFQVTSRTVVQNSCQPGYVCDLQCFRPSSCNTVDSTTTWQCKVAPTPTATATPSPTATTIPAQCCRNSNNYHFWVLNGGCPAGTSQDGPNNASQCYQLSADYCSGEGEWKGGSEVDKACRCTIDNTIFNPAVGCDTCCIRSTGFHQPMKSKMCDGTRTNLMPSDCYAKNTQCAAKGGSWDGGNPQACKCPGGTTINPTGPAVCPTLTPTATPTPAVECCKKDSCWYQAPADICRDQGGSPFSSTPGECKDDPNTGICCKLTYDPLKPGRWHACGFANNCEGGAFLQGRTRENCEKDLSPTLTPTPTATPIFACCSTLDPKDQSECGWMPAPCSAPRFFTVTNTNTQAQCNDYCKRNLPPTPTRTPDLGTNGHCCRNRNTGMHTWKPNSAPCDSSTDDSVGIMDASSCYSLNIPKPTPTQPQGAKCCVNTTTYQRIWVTSGDCPAGSGPTGYSEETCKESVLVCCQEPKADGNGTYNHNVQAGQCEAGITLHEGQCTPEEKITPVPPVPSYIPPAVD